MSGQEPLLKTNIRASQFVFRGRKYEAVFQPPDQEREGRFSFWDVGVREMQRGERLAFLVCRWTRERGYYDREPVLVSDSVQWREADVAELLQNVERVRPRARAVPIHRYAGVCCSNGRCKLCKAVADSEKAAKLRAALNPQAASVRVRFRGKRGASKGSC